MIKLICGPNGSGKTQKLIDIANAELDLTDGLIVYIDRSNNHRLGIDNRIRFINAAEFDIDNPDKLVGMLCGLLAGNYDINRIYIDNLTKLVNSVKPADIGGIFAEMDRLAENNGMQFTITFNSEETEGINMSNFQNI